MINEVLVNKCAQILWDGITKLLYDYDCLSKDQFRFHLSKYWMNSLNGININAANIFNEVYKREHELLYSTYTREYLTLWDGSKYEHENYII